MLATMRFQIGSCQPFLLGQRPKSNFFRLGTMLQAINLAVRWNCWGNYLKNGSSVTLLIKFLG